MFYKKLSLLFILLIFCAKAFSAVFVVTSNADSGPGTLRDALTQAAANGNATQDIIQFNLADLSVAGRTITLNTVLPDLSQNLLIDGTTQPGAVFGVSSSKIKILATYTSFDVTKIYIFNGSNIGDFSMKGLWLSTTNEYYYNNNIVSIANSGNINIDHCLIQSGAVFINTCTKLTFQSNMIGYLPDGITGYYSAVTVWDTLDITIGGDLSQGNLMSGAINLTMFNFGEDWKYVISNNKMGTDYTGESSSTSLFSDYGRITIESGHYNPPSTGKMNGSITNNEIENFSTAGIVVSGFGDVAIKGNEIGTDKAGKINFSQFAPGYVNDAPTAVVLEVGINAIVGGTNPGDGNIIAYVSNGILEQLANQVVISENSIFCINRNEINIHDFIAYPKPLPLVKITKFTANTISGTATPGARVELFSNNEGTCPACEPRTFFSAVTADNAGNWSYTGLIPTNVVASAIYNNQTSRFTKAEIDISKLKVTQSKCGDKTGAIQGINVYNVPGITWVDQNGNTVSNSLDINTLPPGKYKLKAGTSVCGAESAWIEIIDNSVKLNTTNVHTQDPSCNIGGAISGITVSTYQNEQFNTVWLDKNSNQVANTIDVSNLTGGDYTLIITGLVTGCSQTFGPITLKSITSPITLDETNAQTAIASCSKDNGSVTGITAAGATQYQWMDANNKVVGSTADLTGVAPGDYTLTVVNGTGCSKTSKVYHVGQTAPTVYPAYASNIVASCFGDNSGSLSVSTDGLVKSVRWVNSQGTNAGNTSALTNIAAGTYQLYLTDQNGCENYYNTYTVPEEPEYTVAGYAKVTSEQCGLKNGSISATTISGGVPPYTYTWINASGEQVANTNTLTSIAAGTYILNVVDTRCGNVKITYTVNEESESLIAPAVSAVQLCSTGSALISVNDPSANTVYRLYDNATAATPLQEKSGGRFTVTVTGNISYYISQVNGTCESPRAEMDVTVGLSAINIPNAFTPNGDGINDYWKINGIENYPDALIQIFTRYGQKVFEGKGNQHAFDGTTGGKPLPVGTYYYIINLNSNCKLLSGSVTIIR